MRLIGATRKVYFETAVFAASILMLAYCRLSQRKGAPVPDEKGESRLGRSFRSDGAEVFRRLAARELIFKVRHEQFVHRRFGNSPTC